MAGLSDSLLSLDRSFSDLGHESVLRSSDLLRAGMQLIEEPMAEQSMSLFVISVKDNQRIYQVTQFYSSTPSNREHTLWVRGDW